MVALFVSVSPLGGARARACARVRAGAEIIVESCARV